jgi:hypothetical protein
MILPKCLLANAISPHYILLGQQFECYSFVMNKHSATKKRPAKPSRSREVRKAAVRKASARKPARSHTVRKPAQPQPQPQPNGRPIAALGIAQIGANQLSAVPAPASDAGLQTHKFHVGQTVFYTSSPITRPGATGSYKVVRLLPSDGDDYQYRIKNPGEAFERVAKESQLELEI